MTPDSRVADDRPPKAKTKGDIAFPNKRPQNARKGLDKIAIKVHVLDTSPGRHKRYAQRKGLRGLFSIILRIEASPSVRHKSSGDKLNARWVLQVVLNKAFLTHS